MLSCELILKISKVEIKMSFFDIQFYIFKITSVWEPEFNSLWKSFLYKIYSILFLILYGSFLLSLLLFLFMNNWDIRILSTNVFNILLIFVIIIHVINVKRQKEKMIEIVEIMKRKPHMPENIDEENIIYKYKKINR